MVGLRRAHGLFTADQETSAADLISQHVHTAETDGAVVDQRMQAVPDSAVIAAVKLLHNLAELVETLNLV